MNNKIEAMPVDRHPQYGFWTHPVFNEWCAERDYIPALVFKKWVSDNGLESEISELDIEGGCAGAIEYSMAGTFTQWEPEQPDGEGWFVCSIHDSEDGPVCIWLRKEASNG